MYISLAKITKILPDRISLFIFFKESDFDVLY